MNRFVTQGLGGNFNPVDRESTAQEVGRRLVQKDAEKGRVVSSLTTTWI
jgi:hypothetical protein